MKIKTKKIKSPRALSLFILIIFVSVLLFTMERNNVQAEEDDTQEKIEELEEKAQKYREIIDIKQQQQKSLNDHIYIMDAGIKQYETEIEINKKKIDKFNTQILRKEVEIKEQEEKIILQKKLLADLLKSMYQLHNKGVYASWILEKSLSPFLSEKNNILHTSGKINDLLVSLKEGKQKLEEERKMLEKDKEDLSKTRLALLEKNDTLENAKVHKESLLSQTEGEEAKYKKLLAKVEAQKLDLLNLDELYAASGLSIENFDKPDSKYHASLSWYYAQHDPKWGNVRIGNSSSLLKDYGCAVSSVAMVFTQLGSSITPKSLAEKDQYFQWDLIAWPKTWKNISISSSGYSHGNINWSTVDGKIKNGVPVIVYIGKSGGNGGHYVVIHNKDSKGKYVVHDPYFGANIFLDTSRALVGSIGKNSATYMDQMIIYEK